MKKLLAFVVLYLLITVNVSAKIVTLENCYNNNEKDLKFFQANLDNGSWKVKAKRGMTFVSTSGQISSKYTSTPAEIKFLS